jgi:16S rRNA (cytidine1402-2'-O)-methyltransferase
LTVPTDDTEDIDPAPSSATALPSLTLVSTPIGNLGDITLRAIEALRSADHVVAEDTRRSRKLLSHLGIGTRRLSRLDANASEADLSRVVAWMRDGQTVALVTDAGTPAVSDPGMALVREAVGAGLEVTVLPGASAVTVAVAISGLVDGPYYFGGFLPRGQADRATAIEALARREEPCLLFESPVRLGALLRELADVMPKRRVVVARELTKLHEEVVRGDVEALAGLDREWVGEITLVLGAATAGGEALVSDEDLDARIDEELAKGVHTRTVAALVAAWSGRPRREVYVRVVERRSATTRRGPRTA